MMIFDAPRFAVHAIGKLLHLTLISAAIICWELCHTLETLVDWGAELLVSVGSCMRGDQTNAVQGSGIRLCLWLLRRRRCSVVVPGQGRCVGIEVPDYATLLKRPRAAPAVVCFRGVPYARWTGRFEAPAPLLPLAPDTDPARVTANPVCWKPSFNIGTSGTNPPQQIRFSLDSPLPLWAIKSAFLWLTSGYVGDEEQCLQLNIWCPSPSQPRQHRLPVIAFLPGGAFVFGSAHQRLSMGGSWASRGFVVVSVNYRLGLSGFLSLPSKPDNRGLHDMLAALRWVKKNINHFGGDPDNVTLAGHSAGAMAIGALLGVEALYSERLVARTAMISGTGHFVHSQRDAAAVRDVVAQQAALEFSSFAGDSTPPLAAQLEQLSTSQFMRLEARVSEVEIDAERTYRSPRMLPFFPTVEAEPMSVDSGASSALPPPLLLEHPITFLRRRRSREQPTLPLLIGTTDNEYTLFTWIDPHKYPVFDRHLPLKLRAWAAHLFDSPAAAGETSGRDRFITRILAAYKEGQLRHRFGPIHRLFDAVIGDLVFRVPAEFLASELARGASSERSEVFMYRFDTRSPVPLLGSAHVMDMHFLWGNWNVSPYLSGAQVSLSHKRLTRAIMDDFEAFFRGNGATRFAPWDDTARPVKVYYSSRGDVRIGVRHNLDAAELRAWEGVMELFVKVHEKEATSKGEK